MLESPGTATIALCSVCPVPCDAILLCTACPVSCDSLLMVGEGPALTLSLRLVGRMFPPGACNELLDPPCCPRTLTGLPLATNAARYAAGPDRVPAESPPPTLRCGPALRSGENRSGGLDLRPLVPGKGSKPCNTVPRVSYSHEAPRAAASSLSWAKILSTSAMLSAPWNFPPRL